MKLLCVSTLQQKIAALGNAGLEAAVHINPAAENRRVRKCIRIFKPLHLEVIAGLEEARLRTPLALGSKAEKVAALGSARPAQV